MADIQRVIIKRKNRFFQLVDLGESIPELTDVLVSKEDMYAKIDRGVEEYRQGKTKKLDIIKPMALYRKSTSCYFAQYERFALQEK